MRESVSLLLDSGHPQAQHYPVGMVWDEARIVRNRLNHIEATRAVLTQMTVSSLFSKEAGKDFQKLVKELSNGE